MLSEYSGGKVYIATGYTDLRRGIDGLAAIVQGQFQLDPFENALFLFCGRRRDRIKGLAPGKRNVSVAQDRRRGTSADSATVSLADGRTEHRTAESA